LNPLARALHDLHALDDIAARDTPLSRIDPRAQLLVTLCFVITVVSFDRYRVAALLPLALFPAVLAARAEMPARLLGRALLLASPFVLMVALANPLLDRAPMLALAGFEISGGWVSFAAILLRSTLCLSAALVLIGGTGMHALCAALAQLGAPRVFTVQLLFMHRYLFVLAAEAVRMVRAQQLRAVSRQRMGLALYAALTGQLLLRAVDRARRVHQAMLARGFDGQWRPTRALPWRQRDSVFTAGWCAFFLLARLVDLPHVLGRLATGTGAS
jgi:cobalt/nickel transport system permease protein